MVRCFASLILFSFNLMHLLCCARYFKAELAGTRETVLQRLERVYLPIPLPSWFGKWKITLISTQTRERWSTASHLFVALIKITKMYQRECIHFVSAVRSERALEILRGKNKTSGHFAYFRMMCSIFERAVRTVQLTFVLYSLFEMRFIFNHVVLFYPLCWRSCAQSVLAGTVASTLCFLF